MQLFIGLQPRWCSCRCLFLCYRCPRLRALARFPQYLKMCALLCGPCVKAPESRWFCKCRKSYQLSSNHFHCKRPRGSTPQSLPVRNYLLSTVHRLDNKKKVSAYQSFDRLVMRNLNLVTREIFTAICAAQLARHLEGRHPNIDALDVGFLKQLLGVHSLFGVNLKHHFDNSHRVAI